MQWIYNVYVLYLKYFNWRDQEYETLISAAASLTNRDQRMALYRQADRLMVAEKFLIIPLVYTDRNYITLVKPWVKNFKTNLLGDYYFNEIIIEEH